MTDMNQGKKNQNSFGAFGGVVFCIICIMMNIIGANCAKELGLPLYLDGIGIQLSAVIGGYLPGVVVGFLSNLINGVTDINNAYYAVLSVVIAVITAYYARRGYFEKYHKALLVVFPLALVGGTLGSILTFCMYGLDIGSGTAGSVAEFLFTHGYGNAFFSQFIADIVVDLADKFIVVTIVFLLLKVMPENIKDIAQFHKWRQKPLSNEERLEADIMEKGQKSLKSGIIMLVSIMTAIIALGIVTIGFVLYHRTTVDDHKQLAIGTANLVASVVDGNRVEDFITKGESAEGYLEVEKELQDIRGTSEEILYVYVYRILEDGCHVVFDLDTDDVPGSEPGEIVEFDEAFADDLPALLEGKEIEPIESNETYGWLLTAYQPIRDSKGVTQAYACIDISMNRVAANELSFLAKVFALFFGFFITMVVIGIWLAEYHLILPINTMSVAAKKFALKNDKDMESSVKQFKSLDIKTGDEIENLYHSFSMTIEETARYLAQVQEQSSVINKMQNGLILVLADMVESRDQCTGDHVRKTAAYCRIILNELKREGEFSDILTDEYIEDVVNSAPLHDIGKIKVADAILNKPGKLTDEEFEEMKSHTLAGNEIIQQAMELVATDSSYLKEAKNLATYHHEKWNGKGYPTGISGEDIPLSARVMAVADVFDALVSQRSYKKPFTFEEAVKIIEEGSGSHFDPRVARAFLNVQEEARVISKKFMGTSGAAGISEITTDAFKEEEKD